MSVSPALVSQARIVGSNITLDFLLISSGSMSLLMGTSQGKNLLPRLLENYQSLLYNSQMQKMLTRSTLQTERKQLEKRYNDGCGRPVL